MIIHQHFLDLWARRRGGSLDLRRQQARRRGRHQVGGARARQVGNPRECRGTRPDGHRHADPLHGHAGEQGGTGEHGPDGAPWPHAGACQRDRLHRVGRSFVHQRAHPQRRWRQEPLTRQGFPVPDAMLTE